MLLRPGSAGPNTVADHVRGLGEAIAQLPVTYRRKILIRVDGAGATHDLLEQIEAMNRLWRSVNHMDKTVKPKRSSREQNPLTNSLRRQ